MNRIVLISLLVCCNMAVAFAQDTLRIMTYNMAVGVWGSMRDMGKYIRMRQPDIVALQEVDLYTTRPERPNNDNHNQPAELGYYADMLPVFGPVTPYPTGGFYGLGFLSKHPLLNVTTVILPQVVDLDEQRGMLVATWDINGKQLTIANTHLSLDRQNREKQMKFIRSYMQRIHGMKIICGDLNSYYEEGLVDKVFKRWTDALPEQQSTFSSWNPVYKYDWMLYETKAAVEVIDSNVDTTCRLSDHLPCYIDIVIR